jgi:glycosyltransferase involved in cell wall biosynthesis
MKTTDPSSARRPIITLVDKIGWFGRYTGYEALAEFISSPVVRVIPRRNLFARIVGKLYSTIKRWPPRNQATTFSELELLLRWKRQPGAIAHVLYSEDHLRFFTRWERAPRTWVATIHIPPSQWSEERLAHLCHVQSAIMLYQRDIAFFEQFTGAGRIRFVHYGVDVDFFRPATTHRTDRLLFAGAYLRNPPMLARVIQRLHALHPELRFDLLVPMHARSQAGFEKIEKHPAVTWHARLSDEQLRKLYQDSYLLLLPMNESGANTAVVESLACGLPIVTTDVGGIRDYGGGTIFPVVKNDDDDAMVALVEQYLEKPDWREQVAAECRRFAENTLAWSLIAQRHLRAYEELAK